MLFIRDLYYTPKVPLTFDLKQVILLSEIDHVGSKSNHKNEDNFARVSEN